jgi:hypothetical protein
VLYQLKSGKIVDIPVETLLDKTDEELQELGGSYGGIELSDPFCNSVLYKNPSILTDDEGLLEIDLEVEEYLTELTSEEKFLELDMPVE